MPPVEACSVMEAPAGGAGNDPAYIGEASAGANAGDINFACEPYPGAYGMLDLVWRG